MRSVTEAINLVARLNAAGAHRGAEQVAFNAALMAGRGGVLVPAPVCQPANDHHKPPSSAA